MSEVQKLELKYIIENIKLEIEFQDLTDKEMNQKKEDLTIAQNKLEKLQK
ncbi:hypothetical protein [Staphylococcus xylosus]|nr:hypothetical protein [Staphylococcus xylosus]MBM6639607.1 hypothetical protein [Staphylococcus xylosus]